MATPKSHAYTVGQRIRSIGEVVCELAAGDGPGPVAGLTAHQAAAAWPDQSPAIREHAVVCLWRRYPPRGEPGGLEQRPPVRCGRGGATSCSGGITYRDRSRPWPSRSGPAMPGTIPRP
jgi:hypothetical protein